jgi:crotonobetainyl-CoA:carnitine CoA-transferase CaiB-like acyl-CoA transferase
MESVNEWAAGGLAYVTRRSVPDDDNVQYSPVLPPDRQTELLGGIAAATGALAGLRLAAATGEAVLVDVSRQEVQAAMLHGIVPPFVWNGTIMGTPHSRLSNIGMLLPAADGQIYLRTVEPHQWDALVGWMGSPAWAEEAWVKDPNQRRANWDAVRALVADWTAQQPRDWLYRDGQAHRVPVALPRSLPEVLASEQLSSREFWCEVPVGDRIVTAPSIPMLSTDGVRPSIARSPEELLAEWSR